MLKFPSDTHTLTMKHAGGGWASKVNAAAIQTGLNCHLINAKRARDISIPVDTQILIIDDLEFIDAEYMISVTQIIKGRAVSGLYPEIRAIWASASNDPNYDEYTSLLDPELVDSFTLVQAME